MTPARTYLIDTDVVSEVRKRRKANPGVRRFFANAHAKGDALYLSVVTIGEIRRGIESIRHRGDARQVDRPEAWLAKVLNDFADHIAALSPDVIRKIMRDDGRGVVDRTMLLGPH